MMRALLLIAALALSGCATTSHMDLCTGANLRRTAYVATIAAADAWTASGRPVPLEVTIARVGAVAALSLLDDRCPAAPLTRS